MSANYLVICLLGRSLAISWYLNIDSYTMVINLKFCTFWKGHRIVFCYSDWLRFLGLLSQPLVVLLRVFSVLLILRKKKNMTFLLTKFRRFMLQMSCTMLLKEYLLNPFALLPVDLFIFYSLFLHCYSLTPVTWTIEWYLPAQGQSLWQSFFVDWFFALTIVGIQVSPFDVGSYIFLLCYPVY